MRQRSVIMKPLRPALFACSLVLLTTFGCSSNRYAVAPPPPPPYGQVPPLVEVGQRNGFEAGRAGGPRDVERGFAYAPRHSRAFHDCPGYDPHLGPFGPY